MDFFDAAARRHSYREPFTPQRVPRAELERIVDAGLRAPSGCNAQTTRFVIVDDPALVTAIAGIVDKPFVATAPALLVCLADHRAVHRGMSFGVEDCAAAVENLWLALTALGYASVWLDGALRVEDRAARIARLLAVPATLEVRVLLPVGVPAVPRAQRERLPFAERAWFNRYGATP